MKTSSVILWTGPKHAGKTTALMELIRVARHQGHSVGGILSPSRYQGNRLVGFDLRDLHSGECSPLAERQENTFVFLEAGLRLGRLALEQVPVRQPDLAVIDEFGPRELQGENWRSQVDHLVKDYEGLLLLVVRNECVSQTRALYSHCLLDIVSFQESAAQTRVLQLLDC